MKFSWNALALAPLPVPLTVAIVLAGMITAVRYRRLANRPPREDGAIR